MPDMKPSIRWECPSQLDDEKALNRCKIQRDELLAIHDENLELGYFAYVWNEDYLETKGRELRALEELVFGKMISASRERTQVHQVSFEIRLVLPRLGRCRRRGWTGQTCS